MLNYTRHLEPLAQHELPYSSSLYPDRWARLRWKAFEPLLYIRHLNLLQRVHSRSYGRIFRYHDTGYFLALVSIASYLVICPGRSLLAKGCKSRVRLYWVDSDINHASNTCPLVLDGLSVQWVTQLTRNALTDFPKSKYRCGPRCVDLRWHFRWTHKSCRAIQGVINLFLLLISPYSGYSLACCFSWLSLEEGARVHFCPDIRRNVWLRYHLCELLATQSTFSKAGAGFGPFPQLVFSQPMLWVLPFHSHLNVRIIGFQAAIHDFGSHVSSPSLLPLRSCLWLSWPLPTRKTDHRQLASCLWRSLSPSWAYARHLVWKPRSPSILLVTSGRGFLPPWYMAGKCSISESKAYPSLLYVLVFVIHIFSSQYWLWCPIMATCLGGLTGTFCMMLSSTSAPNPLSAPP